MSNYEQRALLYAEKYGIIDYRVNGSIMTYKEVFPSEGTYKCKVDLNTLNETRIKLH